MDTKSSADFSTVTDGVHWLDSKFMDGLDMVNTCVDKLYHTQKSPPRLSDDVAVPPMASKDMPPIQPPLPSPHTGGGSTSTNVLPDYVSPDKRHPLSSGEDDAGTSWSSETLHQLGSCQDTKSQHPRFRDAAESGGMGARMEPRSHAREAANTSWQGSRFNPRLLPHSPVGFQDYARSSSTPNPYYGERDSRNEAARSDPRRYGAHVPPYQQRPLDVDIDYGLDDKDHFQQGGQIISFRHWDHLQQAQLAGHSPLDAAALGCKEYHGYQRGYYPLTADIILCCGYRDSRGG